MNVLLVLAILSGPVAAGGDSLPGDVDRAAPAPAMEMKRESDTELSPDEFVEHFAALYRLRREYRENRDMFEEEREAYMDSHSLTKDAFTSFIAGVDRDPEFWSRLWDRILRELDIAPEDTLRVEP